MDSRLSPEQFETVLAALRRGSKVEAVKLYREATGLGLKEAKDAVEQMEAAAPLSPADRSRIVATLRSFGKVEAIKIHMAATGHQNLLESKEAVEAILAEEGIELPGPLPRQEGGPRITPPPLPTGLTPEKRSAVIEAMSRGNKIEAIKIYREATGKGLAESKEAVEAMEAGLPPTVRRNAPLSPEGRTPLPDWDPKKEKRKSGCFGMVAMLVVAVAAWLLA